MLALDAYTTCKAAAGLPKLAAIGADQKERVIGEAFGALMRAPYLASDKSLWVTPPEATPSWYVLTQSGYDLVAPKAVQNQGIEITREYLNADGTALTAATLGQEITVRLRLRALGGSDVSSLAIVDLLPGGFEPVTQMPPPPPDSGDTGEDDSEDGDSGPPVGGLALPGSTLCTEPVLREDRMVLYASAGPSVTQFLYKLRPSNPGTFIIPPPYAESMYERTLYSQGGPAGMIEVK